MERQIKEAIDKQLEQSDYRPELKDKTLNYLAAKSNKTVEYPNRLRQFSIITACSIMLVAGVAYHYFSMNNSSPQGQTLSSVNPPTSSRHIVSPLTDTLNELGLEHQENVTLLEDNNIMISYMIEGLPGYEIEFTSFLYQIDVCEEVDNILSNHGVKDRPFNMIKLSEYRVFIYFEISDVLLEHLNVENKTLLCP